MKLFDAPSPAAVPPPTAVPDVEVRLGEVEAALAGLAGALVPERLPGHVVERVMSLLGRIERRAGGARLVLAKAAADVGAWRAAGARSPEEHLARQSGTSIAEARADLQASTRLADLPRVRAAAAGGALSKDSTRAVAHASTADPSAESTLLDTAGRGDLAATRDLARRVCHHADQASGAAARRRYQRRGLRTWVELDGEGHGTWNVPPEYQAVWLAGLEPYRQEAFRLARESGVRATPEALMADAMQLLCLDALADHDLGAPPNAFDPARPDGPCAPETSAPGSGPPPRPSPTAPRSSQRRFAERRRTGGNRRAPAQIVVHASYDALIRGHTNDGETCEVAGLGPVPVSFARTLAHDAILKTVLTKGDDVTAISSQRRYIPAPLRAALIARDRQCVVPGCHARHHLQIHHWRTDFAHDGPTELDNLARTCRPHHDLITYTGWTLTGGPGHWDFRPP